MRRIVLVDLYWTRDQDPRVPLGHASLLATLRQDPRLEVVSVVMPVNDAATTVAAICSAILRPAMELPGDRVDIAIGAYVWAEHLIQEVLPALRAAGFEGRMILGGPQVSYAGPGVAALYPDADAFVRGYGESALLSLARASGRRPVIQGVVYRGDTDHGAQASVPLEDLPSPWLSEATGLAPQRFIRWETQRGCPFRCSFCQHREPGARLPRRELSEDRVLREIELFCSKGVEEIAVLDPIFNLGSRAQHILERFVGAHFSGRLSLQCRAETTTDGFLTAAARLRVRLEFGLQTIHDVESVAIERRNDLGRVDATLERVRGLGLPHEVTLIFGLPEQTVESFVASVRWCLERRVPVIKAFPLMLLRGTALERARDRWKLVESEGPMPVVVGANSFTYRDWLEMAKLADALRATEGNHPTHIEQLRGQAGDGPSWDRWRPPRRSA